MSAQKAQLFLTHTKVAQAALQGSWCLGTRCGRGERDSCEPGLFTVEASAQGGCQGYLGMNVHAPSTQQVLRLAQ
jgi:hypothetical protein